jgi:hypothetical protein
MDALSSLRMITDSSGTVVARVEYGAYGEEIFVSAIPALQNFPYRFVGAKGVDAEGCFLICTTMVGTRRLQTNFRHSFLVFGSRASDVYGLYEGDVVFQDFVEISSFNSYQFSEAGYWRLECRRHCPGKCVRDKAEKIAKEGIFGTRYISGMSNVWVYQVLQMANYDWKGFDIWFPTP